MRKKKWKSPTFATVDGRRVYETAYLRWKNMRSRCICKSNPTYRYYGGRGISVCDRWMNSYDAFYEDTGAPPPGMDLDRIDPNGDYEPSNCRWVSRTVNQRNQRRSNNITWRGETHHLIEWAVIVGIPYETLRSRILRHKWGLDRAMTEKLHRRDK